jgi:membrane-associated phospholipid phosphatase
MKLTYVSFGIILLYITYLNIFVFRTTPELIFSQFVLLVVIFRKVRIKSFVTQWLPFISLFLLYEFLRGVVDQLSPFYSTTLYWVYYWEKSAFRELPTITLQRLILPESFINNISLLFYTSFFYYSFLGAFIIWLKKPNLFSLYSKQFIILTYICLIFFFLMPSSPPWLSANKFQLPIVRYIYETTAISNLESMTFYSYFVGNNLVAAFPSLHVAWPMFTTLFVIKHFKSKMLLFLLIVPVAIGFSVVLSGEHYIVDIIAGWLIAAAVLYLSFHENKNKSK